MTFNEAIEIYEIQAERKRVVRDGKKIRKRVCKPGYKLVDGKCVKMKASEKLIRRKAARKAARKRKPKQNQITRKRIRSIRKRI